MNTSQFNTAATQWVDGFGNAAHTAIGAWREGGDRLGELARARWDAAFKEASPELSAETRRNATNARKVIGGYYTKGVALSASGAEVAVDTVVQAARDALERAANWQQTRA